MPRSQRQDHEVAWQHVMNRGIDRQAVFRSDDDRQIFYDCLAAAMPRYDVEVHAWCILDNHFHLLLFTRAAASRTRCASLADASPSGSTIAMAATGRSSVAASRPLP